MDIPQLKLLAGSVRTLLQQNNHPIGHNQALDLIAALPGLRNWPEVQAFPERVAASILDMAAVGRLSFRLKKKYELGRTPQELMTALVPPDSKPRQELQIWPAGPAAGVYVTTSQAAINALLDTYEDATDGALLYAERAGNHKEGSIDLGEDGLWSSGLSRVPSGTLLVIGPPKLDQQFWDDTAGRLEMACLHAHSPGLRVAVLLDTPTPEMLCEDVRLLVRSRQPEDADDEEVLAGVVAEDGDLVMRKPFAHRRPQPVIVQSVATVDAIPRPARAPVQDALAERASGLLVFGSVLTGDHWAIDLVASGLALTEHTGPAARIMPRHRSTPAKDWGEHVPDAIKQLPYLPSIESAYDQGYRRMVITSGYTDAQTLLDYGDDVLFITGGYASAVDDAFMSTMRGGSRQVENELLKLVIALLCVTPVPTTRGDIGITDLFLSSDSRQVPNQFMKLDELLDFITENRFLRLEEQLAPILDSGEVGIEVLTKELKRNRPIQDFLKKYAVKTATI
jgi:hypothetical protein